MKRTAAILLGLPVLFGSFALTGAGGGCSQDSVHSAGGILFSDIKKGEAWKKNLPGELGLPPDQIRMQWDSGFTRVTIKGVDSPADQQVIDAKLLDVMSRNPQLGPLKWRYSPEADYRDGSGEVRQ